jgi:hypothetical protein
MKELFPKQKTKFVDAVVEADRSVFGGSSGSGSTGGAGSEEGSMEKDLDHEDDSNLLGRIEHELRRLESEEASAQPSS